MLRKLLKYDLNSMGKFLFPAYGIVLLLSFLYRGVHSISEGAVLFRYLEKPLLVFTIIALVAIFFLTFAVSIKRFYQNLIQDNGYLTHTLPVTKHQILLAKLLASFIYLVLSFTVIILSVMMAFYQSSWEGFLMDTNKMIQATYGIGLGTFVLLFLLYGLLGYACQLLMIYLAIAIGQMQNTNKVLFSFVSWFGLYIVYEILALIALGITFLFRPDVFSTLNESVPGPSFASSMGLIFFVSTILLVFFGTISYILTTKLLTKRLNLE